MSSSVLGALVLVISLVFFYLYLNNVFRIQYPTPPHVGFSETDITELLKKGQEEPRVSIEKIAEALKRRAENQKQPMAASENKAHDKELLAEERK